MQSQAERVHMRRRVRDRAVAALAICMAFCFVCSPAYAYVPISGGLSALGSFFAVIAAIFLGLVGFVWYPIKRLLGLARNPDDTSKPE